MVIGICDDKADDRLMVREWLLKNDDQLSSNSIIEFASGESVLQYLLKGKINVLFLDCKMHGMSGIDTSKKIRKNHADVIILAFSDYEEFAPYGYDVGVFRYIIKKDFYKRIGEIYESAKHELRYFDNKTITIKANRSVISIIVPETMYIESYGMSKTIIMYNESEYKTNVTWRELKKSFTFDKGFISISISCIINCNYAVGIENGMVTMKNGKALSISRKYSKKALDSFIDYFSERKEGLSY